MPVLRNTVMALHFEGIVLQVSLHGHITEISDPVVYLGDLVSMTEKKKILSYDMQMNCLSPEEL